MYTDNNCPYTYEVHTDFVVLLCKINVHSWKTNRLWKEQVCDGFIRNAWMWPMSHFSFFPSHLNRRFKNTWYSLANPFVHYLHLFACKMHQIAFVGHKQNSFNVESKKNVIGTKYWIFTFEKRHFFGWVFQCLELYAISA